MQPVPELPADPEPLPLPVTDNHTHLDHVRGASEGEFPDDATVLGLIERSVAANVPRMVQIGCDLAAAYWTVEAVHRHPQLVGGVALHPTEATKHAAAGTFDDAMQQIEKLAEDDGVRVVGETGLDYCWVSDDAGRRAQRESFARHIALAKRLGKVLQIHDRDAHDDVLDVLRAEGAPATTVFHCFSGDAAMAKRCADAGWYLSFAGTLTFKNATGLRDALLAVPAGAVLVETDAPYLTPVPFRGRPNGSYLVPYTVRAMAAVTGRDLDLVCAGLADTTRAAYGTW